MGVFEHFPYTNFHDLNLDWILEKMKEVLAETTDLEAWKATHEQEYNILAEKVDGLIHNLVDVINPWDSSIAYHIFTIVEYQGDNYIAVQDVPVGAMITDTDYWQQANTVVEQINAMSVIVSNLEAWKPYVTPEEYGAVGDGETDDTIAIGNAIAGSLTENKPLVLVHTYLTASGITITNDNVQFYCYGEIKYTGTGYAVTLCGQFNTVHINKLTARNGSGMLITPNEKPAYMLDVQINILRASLYGIKIKDYVDPLDPANHRFGVLYDRIKVNRIRVDGTGAHALDFDSDYFIGEINLDIELIDIATDWAVYAVGRGDGINALRFDRLAMEGNMDCIYLDGVHASVFNNLRYSETVNAYHRDFLTMKNACFANIFNGTANLRYSAVDVSDISSSHLLYCTFTMPFMDDSGRLIAFGAKCNGYGMKFDNGYPSATNIRNTFDYYPATFPGIVPTQFNVLVANTSDDYLKIHLDHTYAWDGINRIQVVMNGASYRPVILNTNDEVIYDFRNLVGTTYNGIYEVVFNRSTATTQAVNVYRYEYVTTVGDQPL